MRSSALLCALASALGLACAEPPTAISPPSVRAPLVHDAYVWQRRWTPAVEAAVERPPRGVHGLRVLVAEIAAGGDDATWPVVSTAALARTRRPITAVIRIDGSRPPARTAFAERLAERVAQWRAAGVEVAGVEIDHDCATAALGDYAGWLETLSLPPSVRRSITALPAWRRSPALVRLAAAVDEIVLQVHAVRAPELFDPARAGRWVRDVAGAVAPTGRPLRVALPTYQVTVAGRRLAAEPAELARFVADLEAERPANVAGVVWFRLPVTADRAAWPAATLEAVIAGRPVGAAVALEIADRDRGRRDLVLVNRGNADGPWPAVEITGARGADLVGGYRPLGATRWAPPTRVIRPGDAVVIGWIDGTEARARAH